MSIYLSNMAKISGDFDRGKFCFNWGKKWRKPTGFQGFLTISEV